jgi:hypothetical protein
MANFVLPELGTAQAHLVLNFLSTSNIKIEEQSATHSYICGWYMLLSYLKFKKKELIYVYVSDTKCCDVHYIHTYLDTYIDPWRKPSIHREIYNFQIHL